MLEFPFYHLQVDGFWFLKLKDGKRREYEDYLKKSHLTKKEILETVDHAYLDDRMFQLLLSRDARKKIEGEIKGVISTGLEDWVYVPDNTMNEGQSLKETSSLYDHEQAAIDEIIINLDRYHLGRIAANMWLYENQSNNYYEYDLILVAHSGIYVVELKHWSGHIEILPYKWVASRIHRRPDPHQSNGLKCRILKGIYEHNFKTYPSIWVESVVVLTNQDSIIVGASSPKDAVEKGIHNPTFVSVMDFINYLKKRELASKPVLDDMQIQSIIDYLEGLNNPRPSLRYDVPGYETVEYISQRPECVELVARAVSGKAKGLNRFRVFRIPYQIEQQEKERLIKKAFNTVNAVSQIEDHPHIHKVWVIKNENGDIIEGSEWSETGTLQDLIREQRGRCSADEINDICQGIALALSKAHEVGVIHRALKPENVLMMNNIPKLINFDLAYQIEENHLTVIADVSGLKDDGYIAPEVLFGQDIDEGTDYFGLGIIAYELFTGEKPFASTREFVARGGVLSQQSLQKLVESGATEGAKKAIKEMLLANRQTRLKDSHVILSAFKPKIKKGEEHPVLNAVLQPGSLYDVYEIVKLIDIGATAQIYTAKTVRQKLVVLKLFNKEIPRERIFREAEISSAVQSAYVAHCDNMGHWHEDRFFLVMDLIDGKTLRKMIDRGERPDLRTFRTIVLSLMDAIEAFHSHKDEEGNPSPFLHSDIKPENIMIAGDQKPILIDFGAAGQPRIDIFEGTSGYVPPDSIVGTDMKFSQDGDLYALGITLWEWIFGKKPY
ncbi:MAG: protein kinase, partial [Clostridia bacterium]|nr:protein kinase [Clostridia bacterium]